MTGVQSLDWSVREDANILAQADEIRHDKARYAKAVNAARIMANERTERIDSLRRVSKMGPLNRSSGRSEMLDALDNELRSTIANL